MTPSVSTPRSSSCRGGVVEELSGAAVAGGIVGVLIYPAAPDDPHPGAGEDAHGGRVGLPAGAGALVDPCGPGACVAGGVGGRGDREAGALGAGPAGSHGGGGWP